MSLDIHINVNFNFTIFCHFEIIPLIVDSDPLVLQHGAGLCGYERMIRRQEKPNSLILRNHC